MGLDVGLLAVQHAVADLAAQVDLGGSEASAPHALVVDADSGAAHVAPIAIAPLSVARALVRRQTIAVGEVLP